MTQDVFRYRFPDDFKMDDVEETLVLALLAAEALYGEADVRLDAAHHFSREQHACVIDATTAVGRDLNRLFVGFLTREFGEQGFKVERLDAVPAAGLNGSGPRQ